jgi:two-component system NtrC family sensor kinase
MRKFLPDDQLNCGACGYRTCREKAIAVFQGLAEAEMCLPYLVEELEFTCKELEKYSEDLEKAQASLIHSERLASLGQLSAGVAHELNNPLQIMKSEYSLIKDILADLERDIKFPDPKDLDFVKDSVEQIGLQIDRCKKIIDGLLKFARKPETSIRNVDLPPFIREVVSMVENRAQLENIRTTFAFDPDLPQFKTDPTQLQQVFFNLLNNAIDALKGRPNGEIRIGVSREDESIIVSVADNGCGIAPENLEKIFLPFFTTKPVGQGTGLGLSTSYGIIENLGGKITVSSKLNEGTVFTVRLPLTGPKEKAVAS